MDVAWRSDGRRHLRTNFILFPLHARDNGVDIMMWIMQLAVESGERNVVAAGAHDGRPRVWTAVHAHSVTVARCTPRLFTDVGEVHHTINS